jgi:hypothetical protein
MPCGSAKRSGWLCQSSASTPGGQSPCSPVAETSPHTTQSLPSGLCLLHHHSVPDTLPGSSARSRLLCLWHRFPKGSQTGYTGGARRVWAGLGKVGAPSAACLSPSSSCRCSPPAHWPSPPGQRTKHWNEPGTRQKPGCTPNTRNRTNQPKRRRSHWIEVPWGGERVACAALTHAGGGGRGGTAHTCATGSGLPVPH